MAGDRIQSCCSSRRGAALLAALCFTLVLAIALSSYITVCYRTLQMSTRAVHSDHAIELAEIGLEEALAALQTNTWTTWTTSGATATKTLAGFTYDNNYTGSVSLTVANYNVGTLRTITAVGSVGQYDSSGNALAGTVISRTLTSSASPAPLFVNAIAGTTGKIKFKAAGTVDSYDSAVNPAPVTPEGYSAVLSSGSVNVTSSTVQLNTAKVYGYVQMLASSPANLFYSTGAKVTGPPPPAVGGTPASVSIDANRIGPAPYQPVFDVVTPAAATPLPSFPTSGTINSIGTTGATIAAKYYATSVSLTGSQVLNIDGPVVLVISGALSIGNSAKIVINNVANASLEIHVGTDLALGGSGIDNRTRLPKNLAIFEIANSSIANWDMSTSTPFYGVIFTPDQLLTIGYAQTIYGSLVARAVTFNLSPTFHYDMSLRHATFAGLNTPYAVTVVQETGSGG